MSKEQPIDSEICSICEQHPEDILMLECAHDLCVACAAEIYAKGMSGSGKKSSQAFTCEICLTQTTLDKDSVQCLQAALTHMKKKSPQPSVSSSANLQAPLPPAPPRPRPAQGQCLEHRQPLLYYCFDCRTGQICAECILTERHRGHQVSTFKKATSQIIKQLENEVKERELHKNKIVNEKKKIIEAQVMFRSHVESRRKELKLFFDEVVNLVGAHYQRLTQELDDVVQTSEAAMRGHIDLTEARICQVNQEIERLQQSLKDSDRILINKFSKRVPQETRHQQWKHEPAVTYVSIEYPQQDIVDELTRLLQRMSIQAERGLSSSGFGFSNRIRTEGLVPTHENSIEPAERLLVTDNKKHLKKSAAEITPAKPELKHSLDLASNIISKLQTRQKKFE